MSQLWSQFSVSRDLCRGFILVRRTLTQGHSPAQYLRPARRYVHLCKHTQRQNLQLIPFHCRAQSISSSSSSSPSSSSSTPQSSSPSPSQQPSSPPTLHAQTQPQPSKHRTFYTSYTAPVLKCFLAAMFTYQLTYWIWLKLESLEEEKELEEQVRNAEGALAGEIATRQRQR